MITTRIHAVLNESEQTTIINALAFYNAAHTTSDLSDPQEREQWRMAFSDDNLGRNPHGHVNDLATRIARLK